MAITNIYQDKIMGGLEGDPDPYNFNQLFNQSYTEPVGVPGMDKRAINFIDAPVSFGLRKNNPFVGPIDNLILSRGKQDNNIINRTQSAISSGIGKGFDLGKAAFSGIASLASGIPFLGNILTSIFQPTTPEQKDMLEIYNTPEYQEMLNQIPGMANYNPIYGMGKGYGLAGAIDKRMSRIAKTLQKKDSEVLQKRLDNLRKLKEIEQRAEAERRGQTYTRNANLENIINKATGERDATGGDPGSKGASDQFSNRSGRGRTGYSNGGIIGIL